MAGPKGAARKRVFWLSGVLPNLQAIEESLMKPREREACLQTGLLSGLADILASWRIGLECKAQDVLCASEP